MSEWFDLEQRRTSGVYAKRSLVIVRGEGATLWDDQGTAYIDCVGGQGAANLGHAHPGVVAAIGEQARLLISCPESFYNDRRAALLDRLVGLVPGQDWRVFLCNSGTEAVEAALKFARYSTGRKSIVAMMRGFHGRTFGALSATWNKNYRQPFEPLVPGFHHIPYNNLEALDQAVDEQTAAVLLEVIQGEGGVRPGDPGFLRAAASYCRERGALLIIDEVQTGFGRTGRMFAHQHFDVRPDIVCMAKSMAGGLPIGAVLLGERVGRLTPGLHGSTFGGNPLVCAAALAVIEVIERDDLLTRTEEYGTYLLARLRELESPLIREVRGAGLLVGIELKRKVAPFLAALQERQVLALNAGATVLRLLPPLVIERRQLDRVVVALQEVLAG